ncbi:MAG: hypothetical protein U1A78_06720 [Polyangia bacterium]
MPPRDAPRATSAPPADAAPPGPAARPGAAAPLVLGFGLLAAISLPLFVFFGSARFSLLARLCGWLGLLSSLLPGLWLLTRRRALSCSVVAFGLWMALFCHLAVLHADRLLLRWGEARLSEPSVDLALLYAGLAVPAMWLGWAAAGPLGAARAMPRLRLSVPQGALRTAGAVLVLLSLLADALWLRGLLPLQQPWVGLITVLLPGDLGFAMVLLSSLVGEREPRAQAKLASSLSSSLFWALFAAAAVVALMRGVLSALVKPLLIYLLGWLLVRRRLRLWPVLAALFAVVLLQPVKAEFRARVWDRQSTLSLGERVALYLDLTAQHWLGGETAPVVDRERAVQAAASRASAALQLAHVVELTPASVPYQGGATYRYLRYALIPRLLMPDKPIAQHADVWAAVVYGYTTQSGTAHVMVGLSQLAEAYVNFGLLGGLLVLALCGALFRLIDELLAHPRAAAGALALHLYFVQNVTLAFEGSLANFWGGVLQQLVVYGVALALLGRLSQAGGVAAAGR